MLPAPGLSNRESFTLPDSGICKEGKELDLTPRNINFHGGEGLISNIYVNMTIESNTYCQDRDGKHTRKTAVPKFASFKSNSQLESRGQDTSVIGNSNRFPENQDDAVGELVSTSKAHKQILGQRHPRRHHELGTKSESNRHTEIESVKQDVRRGESEYRSFVTDRTGDPNNLNFGALDRYATASYLRFGGGCVIGSLTNQRIDRAVSTEKEIVLSNDRYGLPKKRSRNSRWRFDHEGERELKIKPQDEVDLAIDSAIDYISLDAARRAKARRESERLQVSSSNEDGAHHGSVKGKTKFQEELTDQDLKYNNNDLCSEDTEGSRPLSLDEMAKKRVQLSRRTNAEPTNFEAWVDMINHQDSELGLERASLTNAERRSNAEIKVSIYEKALRKVKNPEGREILLLGMMQEATRIWASDQVLSYWRNILQQNPQSLRLWTKYLDFMQTSFRDFRFEHVQNVYLNCLNLAHQARASTEMNLDEQDQIFDIEIYLLLRMTLFMRESGFAEHATAAWQALLEFVFFKPISVQASNRHKDGLSREVAISMFENFWDSEVPRIGEEGAKGWVNFSQKQGELVQSKSETANDLEETDDRWKLWLASEQWHTLLSRNPARTLDDVEGNDPYRIVLFSDIRCYLIDPPSVASQQLLLDAFVAFCCLPPLAVEGHESRARLWRRNCFLRNDALRWNSELQESWNLGALEHLRSLGKQHSTHKEDSRLRLGTRAPFQIPVHDYQVCSDTLFAEQQWFSAFDTWQEQCFGDGSPVEVAWVLGSLKSLMNRGAGGEAVALYVLALELRISPGTVRKTAKNVLRKLPFSIRLYNAYALIEYRLADAKQGEAIITTSITMGKKVDGVPQRDFMLLWRTWIWETLSAHSAQEALARLLAFGDEEIQMRDSEFHLPDDRGSANPSLLLRTERVRLTPS